jgi:hypothetical protein
MFLYIAPIMLVFIVISIGAFFTFKVERGRRRAEREYAAARPQVKFSNIGRVRRLSLLPLCERRASPSRYATESGVSYLIRADDTAILISAETRRSNTLLRYLRICKHSA